MPLGIGSRLHLCSSSRQRLRLLLESLALSNRVSTNGVRSEESVMRQRRYPQDQPADSATSSVSALHAVQVALDRRDNGGDAHAADNE